MPRPASVRSLLFAGVSTLALTLAIAEDVRAADIAPRAVLKAPPSPPPAGVLTIWIEGAAIWTGGSNITGVGLPPSDIEGFDGFAVNPPFPTFVGQRPRVGWEAAF